MTKQIKEKEIKPLLCSTPLLSNSFINSSTGLNESLKENSNNNKKEGEEENNSIVRKNNNLIIFKSLAINLDSQRVDIMEKTSNRTSLSLKNDTEILASLNSKLAEAKLARSFVERFFAGELTSLNTSSGTSGDDDTITSTKQNEQEQFVEE